jgi:hypothetical protein
MGLELARYCQDMASSFYGPTKKQLMQILFEFADFYDLRHRLSNKKKLPRKDWLSEWQEA